MSTRDELRRRAEELGQGFDATKHDIKERWGDDIKRLYEERGIGSRVGFGQSPALLVIDMSVAFNDPSYGVGGDQSEVVAAIATMLRSARESQVPIFFFTIAYHPDGRDAGMFGKKIPALLELKVGDPGVEIDPRLAPIEGEMVITKKFSSAFFQTNLASLLVAHSVDTIILTGCSTSGCVRAAALDGVSFGYRVIVPFECVGDRADGPHYANLFDIDSKYGDVVPMAEVLEYFNALPADLRQRRPSAAVL